jgi:hypothetical protein
LVAIAITSPSTPSTMVWNARAAAIAAAPTPPTTPSSQTLG